MPKSVDIMLASLSDNTYKQYDGCIKAWLDYCKENNIYYLECSIPMIINFLTTIFEKGASYGTINSYKSALSLLLGPSINDEHMKRFMKGVFKLKPTAPKYDLTWDPNIVLNYLSQHWPNNSLKLEILSKKTSSLLALVTAHRVQTLSLIKLNNIKTYESEIIIKIPDLIKTSRLNAQQPVLKLPFFNDRPEICPAKALLAYIEKTSSLRSHDHDQLFISYRKPHQKVSSQTLSHWIKDTLEKSGVDTTVFSAHSTRHAATSAANRLGINIEMIRKTAGWSQSSSVFAKFYNKELTIVESTQFARAILSNNQNNQ